MKRIPRPRLVQFWNIWEITPEVGRRGGKQRMGGNMEISNFFIDTQLLFSFFGDAFFSSHICGQIFLFSCISGYKKYGILMYLHTDLYKSELYLCCEQSRVFVYFDIFIFVDFMQAHFQRLFQLYLCCKQTCVDRPQSLSKNLAAKQDLLDLW